MSNPSINRWGTSQIWYNFWYSDVSYSRLVSQDRIFTELVNVYIEYGLNSTRSFFTNWYWFSHSKPELKSYYNTYFWRYMSHKIQLGKKNHLMRYKLDDVFNMRTWVLRYSDWIIINLYWFRPHKKKITQISSEWCFDRDHLTTYEETRSTKLRRFRTLISYKSLLHHHRLKDYRF